MNWKQVLSKVKSELPKNHALLIPEDATLLKLPKTFIFKDHNVYDFEPNLKFFDWSLNDLLIYIDFTPCKNANYQAMALLVLYCQKLRTQGCNIEFILDDHQQGASQLWKNMGAKGLFNVAMNPKTNFRHNGYKPLIAIRNNNDFKKAISTAESYIKDFDVEYVNTLRHVLSELLYNTMEHGSSYFEHNGQHLINPSLIQFTWYQRQNEIHFIIADNGIGIKAHLSQTYKGLNSDVEAIQKAVKPQVSGTFSSTDPYQSKNNAGVGLYISTNIIKKLRADMHIISGNGLLHISPRDITTKELGCNWPGTMVLVSVRLSKLADFAFSKMMQEFRASAMDELKSAQKVEADSSYYISIDNLVGPFAEDKSAAIKIRDERILPNLQESRNISIDFENVKNAPHSFLSALLATPVKRLGMKAYKKIKLLNASPEIRETIDYIFDENTD